MESILQGRITLFLTLFGYARNPGEERSLIILKDKPTDNYINDKVSSKALLWHGYLLGYLQK